MQQRVTGADGPSFVNNEPFGLGRFATDHSQTKTASLSWFIRLIRLTSD